ncbi:MAG TPA: hypothetical protein VNS81_00955 [Nocardioides sp.]|nr:hypothetical protein [Nocardioides sp.]
MEQHDSARSAGLRTLDELALELQRLRAAAGSPSYAEIAVRVGRQRQERGIPAAEARPGRTTVYDAFRTGRRRIDPALVAEIVRALGVDDAGVARWTQACREAQHTVPEPVGSVPPEPSSAVTPQAAEDASPRLGRRRLAVVLVACLAINLVGRGLVDALHLPLYLDMVGTAIAAVVVGPWHGALAGVLTNLGGVPISGSDSLAFAVVNVAGALVWGYGVRRFGMGRTIPRFLALSVVVALVCTTLAVPILVVLYGGSTGHGEDSITATVREATHNLVLAVLSANILTSLGDKLISGFVALAAYDAVRARHQGRSAAAVRPA